MRKILFIALLIFIYAEYRAKKNPDNTIVKDWDSSDASYRNNAPFPDRLTPAYKYGTKKGDLPIQPIEK